MRDIMLILHFIGLAMGLGTSLGMLFLGMAAGRMDPAVGRPFMLNATHLGRMGQWGLVLLFISGGYLLTPYLPGLGQNPLLITKLVLFVVLGGIVGVVSKLARQARAGQVQGVPRMLLLGRVAMVLGLAIVALAVLIFH